MYCIGNILQSTIFFDDCARTINRLHDCTAVLDCFDCCFASVIGENCRKPHGRCRPCAGSAEVTWRPPKHTHKSCHVLLFTKAVEITVRFLRPLIASVASAVEINSCRSYCYRGQLRCASHSPLRNQLSVSEMALPPKDVVLAVMPFVGKETRSVIESATGTVATKTYLMFHCPKPGCKNPIVAFQDKTGFKNPFCHLKACYARGQNAGQQEETLRKMVAEAREKRDREGGTIRSHFSSSTISPYEKTINAYIRLVVLKSLPMSIAEDPEFRRFSRHDSTVTRKTLIAVIYNLVELVEKRIAFEMKDTVGAVLHDGWSCNDTHFVGVIASYCAPCTTQESLQTHTVMVPRLALLAIAPMGPAGSSSEDDNDAAEATTFNTESHLKFFKDTFDVFQLSFSKWCLALISDNTSTNIKISRKANKPMIGCSSHRLNLEVNAMVKNSVELSRVIDKVHRKLYMLRRFIRIRDELCEAADCENTELPMDKSIRFENRVLKYRDMLSEIDIITISLQKRGYSLAQCRDDLDDLIAYVEQERSVVGSKMFQCNLGKIYISANASIVAHRFFETGVCKLQKGMANTLTACEKEAVRCLRKESSTQDPLPSSRSSRQSEGISERLRKRQKLSASNDGYIDTRFLLGSVAEVERLFSVAKNVLTENRRSMTPRLFEAIVFLRVNCRFWDASLVSRAVSMVATQNSAPRLNAHQANIEQEEN
eukprot:IDg1364t1